MGNVRESLKKLCHEKRKVKRKAFLGGNIKFIKLAKRNTL